MITRSANVYYPLPEWFTESRKKRDSNMKFSISLVVPPEFEKKGQKLIDEIIDESGEMFKKYMKKQLKKYKEDHNITTEED